jgi:hypothetical protein
MRMMLVAIGTSSAACYRYVPIDAPTPAAGAEVRARLTDEGAVRLGPLVGNRVEYVDGTVISVADTALTLSVTGTTDRLGTEVSWRGEQVVFPRQTIAGFERRTFDKRRSYMAGGIAAGIVAAVGIGFNISGGGGGGRTSGTGSPR